jgi:hypothetical protein
LRFVLLLLARQDVKEMMAHTGWKEPTRSDNKSPRQPAMIAAIFGRLKFFHVQRISVNFDGPPIILRVDLIRE